MSLILQLIEDLDDHTPIDKLILRIDKFSEIKRVRELLLKQEQDMKIVRHKELFQKLLLELDVGKEITDISQIAMGDIIWKIGNNWQHINEINVFKIHNIRKIWGNRIRLELAKEDRNLDKTKSDIKKVTHNYIFTEGWKFPDNTNGVVDYDIKENMWLCPNLYYEEDLIKLYKVKGT